MMRIIISIVILFCCAPSLLFAKPGYPTYLGSGVIKPAQTLVLRLDKFSMRRGEQHLVECNIDAERGGKLLIALDQRYDKYFPANLNHYHIGNLAEHKILSDLSKGHSFLTILIHPANGMKLAFTHQSEGGIMKIQCKATDQSWF